jgi:transcriptional regulator with XRE-family HTH domain
MCRPWLNLQVAGQSLPPRKNEVIDERASQDNPMGFCLWFSSLIAKKSNPQKKEAAILTFKKCSSSQKGSTSGANRFKIRPLMERHYGGLIAKRRKELGLHQQDLATALSYTIQAISKIENNLSEPDLSLLPKLTYILRLSIDDFLHEKDVSSSLVVATSFEGERIAKNLCYLRISHQLSQDKAAALLGVSTRSYIHYERGESLPPVNTLCSFLDACHCSGDDFFVQDLHAPLPQKEIASHRRHLPVWEIVLLALGGFGVIIGGLTPLWIKLLSQKPSSPNTSLTSSSGKENSTAISSSSATDSSSSDPISNSSSSSSSTVESSSSSSSVWPTDLAPITSFNARCNGSISGTYIPGTYALSVHFLPEDFYDDTKYSQIQWSINNEASTNPGGIEIQNVQSQNASSWNLIVKDNALDQGIVVLQASIASTVDPSVTRKADSSINLTFKNSATDPYSETSDPVDAVKSFSMNLNGEEKVTYLPRGSYSLTIAMDPAGWEKKHYAYFQCLYLGQHPKNQSFIVVGFGQPIIPVSISDRAFKDDWVEIQLFVESSISGKRVLSTNTLKIVCAP